MMTQSKASSVRIAGIEAKFRRAGDHAAELNALTEHWLENGPKPVLRVDIDGEWEVGSVDVPSVPVDIPVILGDVIHNLRSGLDHLVYQIVTALGLKPGAHNYFPIAYDAKEFERLVTASKSNGRVRKGALDPIPPSHPIFKIIREHQPYNRRDSFYRPGTPPEVPFSAQIEWLAVIQRMWNTDKHRMLLRATLVCPDSEQEILDLFGWNPNATLLEYKVNKSILNQSMEDSHELVRFRFAETGRADPHLYVHAAFPASVMLGSQPDGRIGIRFGHGVPAVLIGRADAIFEDLKRFL